MSAESLERFGRPPGIQPLLESLPREEVYTVVSREKHTAWDRNEYSDSTIALAEVCMNVGGDAIREMSRKYNRVIHPWYDRSFQTLPLEDRTYIRLNYLGVAVGAFISTLRPAIDHNAKVFYRQRYCDLYNNALRGTTTPKLTVNDITFSNEINEDGDEVFSEESWKDVKTAYYIYQTINVSGNMGDSSLPEGIAIPMRLHKDDELFEALCSLFTRRVLQIRNLEIPEFIRSAFQSEEDTASLKIPLIQYSQIDEVRNDIGLKLYETF